ncbi:MAG: hypothetical protein ACQETL_17415 [Bacteroidota bacterium]
MSEVSYIKVPFILLIFCLAGFGCSLIQSSDSPECEEIPNNVELFSDLNGLEFTKWTTEQDIFETECGYEGENINVHHNLTELYGEREFTRNVKSVDINRDGRLELVMRTMNENQVRAIDQQTGRTLWVSPHFLPADQHPQISDIVIEDIDDDGNLEIIIASYTGHVICINGNDGSIKWHKELDYHINNTNLSSSLDNITGDKGYELALTVSNDFDWGPRSRPRINYMRNPTLLILKSDGTLAWKHEEYDKNNSNGHNTWAHDIDEDGLAEIVAIGDNKIIVFDSNGEKMFSIPMKQSGHPDKIVFGEWTDNHEGKEIIYIDGINAIGISSNKGEVMDYLEIPDELKGHLQDIYLIHTDDGPNILAQNIRQENAKTTLYNRDLEPVWTTTLPDKNVNIQNAKLIDWNSDGYKDIAMGSINEDDYGCSLQIMEVDGTPLYWHRWSSCKISVVTDVIDSNNDTNESVLVAVGVNEGNQGRFSLSNGHQMNLFILNSAN